MPGALGTTVHSAPPVLSFARHRQGARRLSDEFGTAMPESRTASRAPHGTHLARRCPRSASTRQGIRSRSESSHPARDPAGRARLRVGQVCPVPIGAQRPWRSLLLQTPRGSADQGRHGRPFEISRDLGRPGVALAASSSGRARLSPCPSSALYLGGGQFDDYYGDNNPRSRRARIRRWSGVAAVMCRRKGRPWTRTRRRRHLARHRTPVCEPPPPRTAPPRFSEMRSVPGRCRR